MRKIEPANSFFLVGAFLIAGAAFFIVPDLYFRNNAVKVTGKVKQLVTVKTRKGTLVYHPIFSYPVNGQEYTREYSVASNPPDFEVGDELTIYYNKNNPGESEYYGWVDVLPAPFILSLGLMLTIIGAFKNFRKTKIVEG